MRTWLALAAVFSLSAGSAFAACGSTCVQACPKPPKMKWVKVTEMVTQKVPVRKCVEEMVEVTCYKTEMQEKRIQVPRQKDVVEEVMGTRRKQVWEEEQYESCEYRDVKIACEGTRKVCKVVEECVEKQVTRTVYDETCDPATGRMIRCPRKITETVQVPVKRKVIEVVPHTYFKVVKEKVPVTKTRKVCKWIDEPCTQKITRTVTVMEDSTTQVAVKVPYTVKQPRQKVVVEYEDRQVCVTKRVQVPCEPAPVCANPCS